MNPLEQSKNTIMLPILIALTLGCFALSSQAQTCQKGCLAGNSNTALGDNALINNTGDSNTAIGGFALVSQTAGGNNIAVGSSALGSNTIGFANVAIGVAGLESNIGGAGTEGSFNTAIGDHAVYWNTIGFFNTAAGANAMYNNTTGNRNTAYGYIALQNNTTGIDNIAVGEGAGRNLTIGDHNIDIGNQGSRAESNTIRIGRVGTQTATYIAAISGATVPTGVPVIVDTTGHLGTTMSSARFKEAIKPMNKASEAILALKPVTFQYKKELDPKGIPQFGLVAEEVEKVDPDLVARDEEGKPYTVRYEAVSAMLLNEFLKEHRNVQELRTTVARQQKAIDTLTASLKAQAAQIQKVNDQLAAQASAPRMVAND